MCKPTICRYMSLGKHHIVKRRACCIHGFVPLLLLTAYPFPAEALAVHWLGEKQSVTVTKAEMTEPWQYIHLDIYHIGFKKHRD